MKTAPIRNRRAAFDTGRGFFLAQYFNMDGSKKRSVDLEVSAVEEAPGRRKFKVVVSKSCKKAKKEAENGDLEAEQTPKEKKKKKKRKRQSDAAEFEPPEILSSEKDAGNGTSGDDSSKKGKKKMDEEGQDSGSVEIEFGSGWDDVTFPNASNASVKANSASLEAGSSNLHPVRRELHMDVFNNLSSADSRVREAASLTLIQELQAIQQDYESRGMKDSEGQGLQLLEATKDEGLKACAPTLRYALRRLIRGVSSSRPYARQGFAVGFAAVIGTIPCIELQALVKLIEELLEVSSSMNGQEARDVLLGRLFVYGALVRSGRITSIADPDENAKLANHVTQYLLKLAEKKNFMRESAITIILNLVDTLPMSILLSSVLEAPLLKNWLQKDPESGSPDALLLALRLHDKLPLEMRNLCKLLPHSCNLNDLFVPEHMLLLAPCLKETSFCHPRVHSVWPVLIELLFSDMAQVDEDTPSCRSSKKKKSKKHNNPEKNLARRLTSFWEVVVEGSLLSSSHDRKHLAIDILQMLLPRIPVSCVPIVLSYKFVQCLLDILSGKENFLYKSAEHILQELSNWALTDDEHRMVIVIALQYNSDGRFDQISRTRTVRQLVNKFDTRAGCLSFIQKLMGLFLEGSSLPRDKHNRSDKLLTEGKDGGLRASGSSMEVDAENSLINQNNPNDLLRSWIVDCLRDLPKSASLDPATKFCLQKEILRFFAVQGLFAASLGTEVTSFELQERLKWPKEPTSSHIRKLCLEQMQHLLADAQCSPIAHKHAEMNKGVQHEVNPFDSNDLGAYVMCFLKTLQNIPSISLFWPLSKDDEDTFKKLLSAEAQIFQAACKGGADFRKMEAMRYLLIQLLLGIPLRPGEVSETANDLVTCCKKAFGSVVEPIVEDQDDDNETPVLMDVLVDTLLSLLPQSSTAERVAVEQVFRCFCDNITESGLLNMLRVINKELKPARHKLAVAEDSDEEDLVDIEESESDDQIDELEEYDNMDDDLEQDSLVKTGPNLEKRVGKEIGDSENSGSDFDDEAMFRMDSYLANIFKAKKNTAGDNAQAQLLNFKGRVLSLLELFLQRNSSNYLVFTVYSYLLKAFVNSSTGGTAQFAVRIGCILRRRIFKAKRYPKSPEVDLSLLEGLLDKTLRLASSTKKVRKVKSLAQGGIFWILKVIHGNCNEKKMKEVCKALLDSLEDIFVNKKCQLKFGFFKEVFSRYQCFGIASFGMLVDKCQTAKSEFLQYEALSLMDSLIRPLVTKSNIDSSHHLQFLKDHSSSLSKLIQHVLEKLARKSRYRSQACRFCLIVLKALSLLKLEKSIAELLKPYAYAACESNLGDLFLPFKSKD